MSAMKNLYMEINELLDTTNLLCEDIAEKVSCPVSFVNDIVEQRWNDRVEDDSEFLAA
jgi:predicted XRE-type DNA-binding protein